MKRILSLLVLVTLPASLRAAKVEMPEWEETSAAASYQLGGGLWPTGLIDGEDENVRWLCHVTILSLRMGRKPRTGLRR